MKVSHSVLFNVEVQLGSSIFSVHRIRLIVLRLLSCFQHGFIRSKKKVLLGNISTHWVFICSNRPQAKISLSYNKTVAFPSVIPWFHIS